MAQVFIVGCGYLGERVAKLALAKGDSVSALLRYEEKAGELQDLGICTYFGNLDEPETLSPLPLRESTLFYFAPPPGGGVTDTRVRNFCGSVERGKEPRRVVYVSTTAVYGDTGGSVVDEESPVRPETPHGKRRLDAERVLLEWGKERGVVVVILRVAGIYGPGKLPYSQLQGGHPVLRPEEAKPSNRIHADDLAGICMAAAERGEGGDIFNVSDGNPSSLTDYFDAAADALGLPRPPRVSLQEAREAMSPLMYSYVTDSRIVDNRKVLKKLGVTLLYPDLRAGLKDIS